MSWIYNLHVTNTDQHTMNMVLNILMGGACIADLLIFSGLIKYIYYNGTLLSIRHLQRTNVNYEPELIEMLAQAKADWYQNYRMPITDITKLTLNEYNQFIKLTSSDHNVKQIYQRYARINAMTNYLKGSDGNE